MINSETFLNLKIQSRVLPVEVHVDDIAWINTQGLRIFNTFKAAIEKDLNKILEKERGVLVVSGVLAIEYELTESIRRDHLLVGEDLERFEVFPYKLRVRLYPPDHVF